MVESHLTSPVIGPEDHPKSNESKHHGHERTEGKRTKDNTDGKV